MRKYFLIGSLGILSIGWFTGCSLLRGTPDDCAKCPPRAGLLQKSCTSCQTASVAATPKITASSKVDVVTDPRVSTGPIVMPPPLQSQASTPIRQPAVAAAPAAAPKRMPDGETLPALKMETAPAPLPSKPARLDEAKAPPPIDLPKPDSTVVPVSNKVVAEVKPTTPEPTGPSADPIPAKPAVGLAGHSEKYASVTGELQEYRGNFRLRYAPIDQEDAYGGVVLLEGNVDVSSLHEGKHARATGELIPPTTRTGVARYRVKTIEILD